MTDIQKLYRLLKSDNKLIAMLAPSFPVDFEYPKIVWQLKRLGFDKVVELTFGAKMVNVNYHKIIGDQKDKVWIASTCPTTVITIQTQFPELVDNLVPVVSPMAAMSKICKKYFPEHIVVFIGPCITKKLEAKKYKEIKLVLTFKELKTVLEEKKIIDGRKYKKTFDKFYNDYTKIYPIGGALASTMHAKDILKKNEVITVDGHKEVLEVFNKLKMGKLKWMRFIDCLDCTGGCIGGPGIGSTDPIDLKKKKIVSYREHAWNDEKDLGRAGKIIDAEDIDFILP